MSKVILPTKSCFGNYLHQPQCVSPYECEMHVECNRWTNFFKGVCNCPYKLSCQVTRQRLQAEYREETGDLDIRKCDFYKYFI